MRAAAPALQAPTDDPVVAALRRVVPPPPAAALQLLTLSAAPATVATATCPCADGVVGADVSTVKAGTPRDDSIEAGAASSATLAGAEALACTIL
jgi:hypothetical protein